MRKTLYALIAVFLGFSGLSGAGALAQSPGASANTTAAATQSVRERINIDKDWRFAYGHATEAAKDFGYGTRAFFFAKAGYGDGPAAVSFDDRAWRKLDLPHDWAVELPFDGRGDTNHGSKAIGANFPENSVGWYRKTLVIPASDEGKRISLVFDGVYRDSILWVNGHYIGTEPSGYTSFTYDITDYINYGGANVIAVRADASREEGWFYEGAGIYRHVWLTKTAPLHVAQWGTFVSSTVADQSADVTAQITVTNNSRLSQSFLIEQQVVAPNGTTVATQTSTINTVEADSTGQFTQNIRVAKPDLWTLATPQLYRLVTLIRQGGGVVDRYETPFGIRTIAFDKDKGFFLNGQHIELQGVNNHQDFAGIGVAVPDAVQDYRLRQLKRIGVNALRMSHNPPNPEVLDAADRLGFLVIDEHRMMGTTPEIRGQLEAMVKRDRNHPSVILWSVGNEEWALEWSTLGTRLADDMQWIVQRLDPTRRTTLATSGSSQGVSLAADVIGFNYHTQHDIDTFHKLHPEKPAVMTEEGSTTATRGIYFDDRAHVHLDAYDREARPGNSASIEEAWRFTTARPFLAGMFVWTGFDYRGETTPFGWPAISSQFGMLDTTGVIKDSGYYLKSVWTETPMVHLLPHWNWAGKEGQPINVWAYANTDAVELFLNGKSLGLKVREKQSHLEWSVPYAAGTLTAKAYTGGKLVASTEVSTTGPEAAVALMPDRTSLKANGTDVSVITVNITDSAGRIVPTAAEDVRFDIQGPGRIIGVGNGDPASHESDRMVDRYRFLSLTNWHSLAVDSSENRPEVAADQPTQGWRNPFQWLPPEQQPPVTKALVLRGEFARPELAADETVQLFVSNLGANQRIYLNGKLAQSRALDDAYVIDIQPADLLVTNSLTYVFETPAGGVPKLADASQGGVNWATLRVTQPAGIWHRQVFSGYAQVLVQSSGGAGQIVVTAQSSGLKAAVLNLTVQPLKASPD